MDLTWTYPTVPQLWGSNGTADDRFMSKEESAMAIMRASLVEEKVDGLNVGIGFTMSGHPMVIQKNRLVDLGTLSTLTELEAWWKTRLSLLREVLGIQRVLFGELIDSSRWLTFDVLNAETGRFARRAEVEKIARAIGVETTPVLWRAEPGKTLDASGIAGFLGPSRTVDGLMEGVVLRVESANHLEERFKWVRPGFKKI